MNSLVIQKPSLLISSAKEAFKFLHGTINIYKPAGMDTQWVIRTLKQNLCSDLNSMELPEPPKHVRIESVDNKNFAVHLVPNFARHVLSMGPEYTPDSLKILPAHSLSYNMSGVMILGINKGTKWAMQLRHGSPIQTYEVVGKFGTATETGFGGDRVTARASYGHITAGKLQALISSMQATFQRQMFAVSGVDIQSQAAYELACKGLIRPKDTTTPMIYGIRSIGNVGKTFTLEVQAMNVNEQYLSRLVNTIAMQLRSAGHCMKIRCTRVGYFSYADSLLRSHWNLQNVIENMHVCQKIWDEHPSMVSREVSTPVGGAMNTNQSE